jgi:hypothetical protein
LTLNLRNQNNFQSTNQPYQNQNQNQNQNLTNQSLNNQAQIQNEATIAARGYNPQQDLELAAEMGQKTQGEIQRILASKAVTGIEFGYVPFPESGPNQMNNQNNLNNQYNATAPNNMNNARR